MYRNTSLDAKSAQKSQRYGFRFLVLGSRMLRAAQKSVSLQVDRQ